MKSKAQDQHKVPEVYLKKFGYRDENNQWKVSVIKIGEQFTRQKSIGSFTAETNVFDIESEDPEIRRLFESLNTGLDSSYNSILEELDQNGSLSQNADAYLMQFIANLICRSDYWRDWAKGMLAHKNRPAIIKAMLWFHFKDKMTFTEMEQQPLYKLLAYGKPELALNRVLMMFNAHLLLRLQHYEFVFLKSQEGKPWYSSTNPVIVENRISTYELLEKESELYFPLSPKYLVYLHCPQSDDKENDLRGYKTNAIHPVTNEQTEHLVKKIIGNAFDEYVIVPIRWEYDMRKEKGE